MYVYQFKAFIHEMLQYCMHSRTHPSACAHTQTLTSYIKTGFKKPGTCLVEQFSCDLKYWYHYSQYWLCTKYLKLPAYCRAPMYVYDICMLCCPSDTPSKRLCGLLYMRTYVCHISCTVYRILSL